MNHPLCRIHVDIRNKNKKHEKETHRTKSCPDIAVKMIFNIFAETIQIKMAKETERKFLVKDQAFIPRAIRINHIRQAYLSTNPDATVRIRIMDSKAFLTVKSRNVGATRNEWEYEIPVCDADEMIGHCAQSKIIDKTRYVIPSAEGLNWEVDVFHGIHDGLILAEIELPDADIPVFLPDFIGEEVTGNPEYYNSSLAGI